MSQDDIDRIFEGLCDYIYLKVQVTRKEPRDAAGYLGTIEIFEDEPLTPDTLYEHFGGGTYHLHMRDAKGRYKGHRTLQVGGPPRTRPERPCQTSNRESDRKNQCVGTPSRSAGNPREYDGGVRSAAMS